MPIGIDPKVDFAFKLVLGNPAHTGITIHFLNAVLQMPSPLVWVEILNPIQGKDRSEEKLVVLDVLAKDSQGRLFNIEMQTTLPSDLTKRLTYYNCINYIRQIGTGEGYLRLRPAISICVLDRILFAQASEYHLSFRLRCDQHEMIWTDDLQFHTLELPKFKPPADHEIGNLPPLEKWLYFLRNAAYLERDELVSQLVEQEFEEATGVLEMISKTPDDRQFYESRMKFLHDEEGRLVAAREEGLEKGMEKGLEKGLEKGMEKGEWIGKIQMCETVLGLEPSESARLSGKTMEELSVILAALRNRLDSRDA